MKRIFYISAIPLALLLAGIGCKKGEIKYGDFDRVTPDQALLKINNVSAYASNPSAYLAIDGARVSNPITARTPFPGGGYNTGGGSTADYLALTPGKHQLSVVIPKKGVNADKDSVSLYSTEINIESGKSQTVHITDTAASTKMVMTTDNRAMPDTGTIRYQFINLMPNVPAIDLYFGTTLVASNVAYMGISVFTMAVPGTSQAWTIRPAGALPTSTALATYTSSSTIVARRVITAFAVGYSGLTDAARKPYISFLLNW